MAATRGSPATAARATGAPAGPARRTQQERSAETTARILAATIDLLHDRGLNRTSTSDIAARAGLSRGALSHHFGSREEIVVAAVAQQLREAAAKLHLVATEMRRDGGTIDDIVDHIWRLMNDRLFYVTMEYLPEARHNPDFHAAIVPVTKVFHEGLDAVWAEIAARTGIGAERAAILMNATMCMIRGMIAQSAIRNDPAYYAAMLAFWKESLRRDFATAEAPPPGRARAGTGGDA